MKICTKCGQSKSLDDFGRDPRCLDGRKSRCKKCSNRDSEDSKKARYHSDPAFREKRKAKKRARKYLDKDRQNANCRRWFREHPAYARAKSAKRHVQKLQASPKWLTGLHWNQMQIFYQAAVDLTKEFGIKMEVDHIIPLQGEIVSGLHVPWNLQVISKDENLRKGNRL